MRNLAIIFGVIALFFGIKKLSAPALADVERTLTDEQIALSVQQTNEKLPITTPDGSLRIERMEYSGHVLRVIAQQLTKDEFSPELKTSYERGVKQMYCTGKMKVFFDAAIPVESQVRSTPRSLQDLSFETWTTRILPSDCA